MVQRRKQSRGKKPKRQSQASLSKGGGRGAVLNWIIWGMVAVNLAFIVSMVWRISSHTDPSEQVAVSMPTTIRVEVLNGCGIPGLAHDAREFLRTHEFDVVNAGNYDNYDQKDTKIVDRVSMDMTLALKVADALGVSHEFVLYQTNDARMVDVSVILGKDYKSLRFYSRQ